MAVTEVKQQQAIMQKLAEMKKGGASDTEIDRKEEAKAILKFAESLSNKKKKKLSLDDLQNFVQDVIAADTYLCNCNDPERLSKKLKEFSKQYFDSYCKSNNFNLLF